MICPTCNTENSSDASQCVRCGATLPAKAILVPELPPLPQTMGGQASPSVPPSVLLAAPPPIPTMPTHETGPMQPAYPPPYGTPYPAAPQPYAPESDIIQTLIPGRNPKALIGYYLAVFSIIPVLGILLGIAAFVLGILGLKEEKRNPAIKGKAHAWIAIVVGGLFGFGYLIFIVWGIVLIMLSSSHTNF